MTNLQEIISRARFIFSGAPKRKDVFRLINGKNSTKEIAKKTGRSLSSVLQDIEKLRDLEIIQEKKSNGAILKKEGASVFEKTPLIKHVPDSYFNDIADTTKFVKKGDKKIRKIKKVSNMHIPNEKEILDICNNGENQFFEFKSPGTKMENLSKEIAAFLNTKNGGILFYGIDDSGTIVGSDINRQDFDQRIHNSVRNTIRPHPNIDVKDKNVFGAKIILILIPPWDKKSIYQYEKSGRYLIRRGTNRFAVSPEELNKLSKGKYVV